MFGAAREEEKYGIHTMRRTSFLTTLLLMTLPAGAALAAPPRAQFLDAGRFPGAQGRPATVASPTRAKLETASRALLEARIDQRLELGEARHLRLARGEQVVRMKQTHRGLPVAMRGASVTFAADGVARLVGAKLEDALPEDVTPAFGVEEAAARASAAAGLPLSSSGATLAIWPGAEGGQLAYVVSGRPIPSLPLAPVVVLDAKSGELIVRFDAATALNKAKMYPSNPLKSPALEEVTLPVKEGEKTLVNDFVVARNCIDEKEVKDINFSGFNLKAHICSLLQKAEADGNGDFLIDPPASDTDPEDAFSEVSIFHHTNRMLERIRSYAPDFEAQSGAIEAIANLRVPQGFDTFDLAKIGDPNLPLQPFQNAFFAPNNPLFSQIFGIQGGAMWFGQGPKRDYAYDGDVVYHEFMHAVVNATVQLVGTPHRDEYGVSMSPGGMNEALADYFSSVLTGDADVGEYASTDLAPNQKAIRSLSDADSCPTAIGGQVHQDATLFSGGLWDLRVTLSPEEQNKLDAAVFSAMNSAPSGDLGYEDLAKLIQEAVKVSMGQPAADKLTAAFTKRGVLPSCTRILEHTTKALFGPAKLLSSWFSLGTSTTGVTKTFNPGVVQFHKKLDAGATRLVVTFKKSAISSGGGAGNPFGGGGTPFAPVVGVHFGTPITFSLKPYKVVETLVTAEPVQEKTTYKATFDVPAGVSDAYVMISNKGQQDGGYTAVDLVVEADPPAGGAGGEAGAGGSDAGSGGSGGSDVGLAGAGGEAVAGAGGAPGAAANPTDVADDGGCGCRTTPASPAGGTFALAAAALLAARRRRRLASAGAGAALLAGLSPLAGLSSSFSGPSGPSRIRDALEGIFRRIFAGNQKDQQAEQEQPGAHGAAVCLAVQASARAVCALVWDIASMLEPPDNVAQGDRM
jgi:MYXO-CTERM domain-containing protein